MHPFFGAEAKVRINGIDAPEIGWRAQCDKENALAIEARQFTLSMMEHASQIDLRNVEPDTFYRLRADVIVDGVSIGARLLECGLALPYDGKQKPDWCR